MAELRVISTRAEISPTRFRNEYKWGDLKADPAPLMKKLPRPEPFIGRKDYDDRTVNSGHSSGRR